MTDIETDMIIIGARPAGLTAGYLLSKANVPIAVIEKISLLLTESAELENIKIFLISAAIDSFPNPKK
jgi:2-polyprenyl-6-methoxyphenol hydroxylase-like FAD-dependent oxidoreductase